MKQKRVLSKQGRRILQSVLMGTLGIGCFACVQIYGETYRMEENIQAYQKLRNKVIQPSKNEEESIDWEALRNQNADIAGWIYQKGTSIDYPIVYGFDNAYYLRHSLDGEENLYGTIFVDCQNQRDFQDCNTVLYGHTFSSYEDVMFTSIHGYHEQAYYEEHPEMDLYTPAAHYKLYPIAGVIEQEEDTYIRTNFVDEEDFRRYIEKAIAESTFHSAVSFTGKERTVLLSTCCDLVKNGRFGLFCVLVQV